MNPEQILNDLPYIVLDNESEDELLLQIIQRTITASNGILSDFSPGSVLYALSSGQAFAIAELLYYLNMLPTALALEVLRLSGVSRKPGTKATGSLTFLLNTPLASNFVVSAGTVIPWLDAGYKLLSALVIPAGSQEGKVDVEATAYGAAYNAEPFAVRISNTGFSYAQTIYNVDRISGGSEIEPLEKTVARAQNEIRSRGTLVSVTDYETKAEELIGYGYAKVIPMLGSDRITEKVGQVHCFLINADGTIPSVDTCQQIQLQMQSVSFAGSRVWVSPAALYPFVVEVVIDSDTLSYAQADLIRDTIAAYFDPSNLSIGADISVKKIEYALQSLSGVREVVSVLANGTPLRQAMPQPYTLASLQRVIVTLTDPTGLSNTWYLGSDPNADPT